MVTDSKYSKNQPKTHGKVVANKSAPKPKPVAVKPHTFGQPVQAKATAAEAKAAEAKAAKFKASYKAAQAALAKTRASTANLAAGSSEAKVAAKKIASQTARIEHKAGLRKDARRTLPPVDKAAVEAKAKYKAAQAALTKTRQGLSYLVPGSPEDKAAREKIARQMARVEHKAGVRKDARQAAKAPQTFGQFMEKAYNTPEAIARRKAGTTPKTLNFSDSPNAYQNTHVRPVEAKPKVRVGSSHRPHHHVKSGDTAPPTKSALTTTKPAATAYVPPVIPAGVKPVVSPATVPAATPPPAVVTPAVLAPVARVVRQPSTAAGRGSDESITAVTNQQRNINTLNRNRDAAETFGSGTGGKVRGGGRAKFY